MILGIRLKSLVFGAAARVSDAFIPVSRLRESRTRAGLAGLAAVAGAAGVGGVVGVVVFFLLASALVASVAV